MEHTIQLSESLRNVLLNPKSLPSVLEIRGDTYTLQQPIKAGYKGVVWKVTDYYTRSRAAKLAIYEDYESRSFLQELTRAATLDRYPQFAKFIAAEVIELDLADFGKKAFVCFIEEWIDGLTLEDYLDQFKETLTGSFLLGYVEDMCSAIAALRAVNLRHDDLHAGNVMLERPAPGMLSDIWKVKVIDTGSLKPFDVLTKKPKDDHKHFVEHLVSIHNAIIRKKLALWYFA